VVPYEHPSIIFGNWGVLDGQKFSNGSLASGIVSSPRNVLSNPRGGTASMSCPGGSFDVLSLYMTPAWPKGSNMQVILVGSYGDGPDTTVTLQLVGSSAGPPTIFESELLVFRNIDKLTFTPITTS